MTSKTQSQLQIRFKTTAAYKRSREHFDISLLNKIQLQQELSRRKPSFNSNDNASTKFLDSFYSTDLKLNERVQMDLSKCHANNWKDENDETETNYTANTPKRRALDMNKMLSREYVKKTITLNSNQNHFCNYHPYILPNNHTIHFERGSISSQLTKTLPLKPKSQSCKRCIRRQGSFIHEIPFITQPQVGKTKQKLLFDQSIFKTLVDLKKYSTEKSGRNSEVAQTQQKLDHIALGVQMTHKRTHLGLVQFYHGNTKWTAPQMDHRLIKQNQCCLNIYNQNETKNMDWTMKKRKADLIQARRLKSIKKKQIKDVKGQYCDEKYFRRNHH